MMFDDYLSQLYQKDVETVRTRLAGLNYDDNSIEQAVEDLEHSYENIPEDQLPNVVGYFYNAEQRETHAPLKDNFLRGFCSFAEINDNLRELSQEEIDTALSLMDIKDYYVIKAAVEKYPYDYNSFGYVGAVSRADVDYAFFSETGNTEGAKINALEIFSTMTLFAKLRIVKPSNSGTWHLEVKIESVKAILNEYKRLHQSELI